LLKFLKRNKQYLFFKQYYKRLFLFLTRAPVPVKKVKKTNIISDILVPNFNYNSNRLWVTAYFGFFSFQESASVSIEKIIDLHHDLMVLLILISILVLDLLYRSIAIYTPYNIFFFKKNIILNFFLYKPYIFVNSFKKNININKKIKYFVESKIYTRHFVHLPLLEIF